MMGTLPSHSAPATGFGLLNVGDSLTGLGIEGSISSAGQRSRYEDATTGEPEDLEDTRLLSSFLRAPLRGILAFSEPFFHLSLTRIPQRRRS